MDQVHIRPRPGPFRRDLGAPELPPSKSHAQRALLLAAGCSTPVDVRGAGRGDDTTVFARALHDLGADVQQRRGGFRLARGLPQAPCASLFLAENASALRFLAIAVPMLGGRLRLDGAGGLRRRPMDAVFALLAQAGIRPSRPTLPLLIDGGGGRWPDVLRVDARLTTQPASGALLGLALRVRRGGRGGAVHVAAPCAPGYLQLTVQLLRAFGHRVEQEDSPVGDLHLRVHRRVDATPAAFTVPADRSAAVFPAALAAMHGGHWTLAGDDLHPDAGVVQDLERLRRAAPGELLELDQIGARPDSFPALCAVAAARRGETRLTGAPALRFKESDRIAAMAAALGELGVACAERDDGVVVRGPLRAATAAVTLPAVADHRVIMALALLGTRTPGGVVLAHADAVSKSWPGFFAWLARVAEVRQP